MLFILNISLIIVLDQVSYKDVFKIKKKLVRNTRVRCSTSRRRGTLNKSRNRRHDILSPDGEKPLSPPKKKPKK